MAKKSSKPHVSSAEGDQKVGSRGDSIPEAPVQGFEESIDELETIVRRLEQGGGALDDALADYSKAILLLKDCHSRLERAERCIEVLSGFDAQGNPITVRMEETEASLDQKQKSRGERRTASGVAGSQAHRSTENDLDDSSRLF